MNVHIKKVEIAEVEVLENVITPGSLGVLCGGSCVGAACGFGCSGF